MSKIRSFAMVAALLACSVLLWANLGCAAARVHAQVPAFAQAVSLTAGNVREALDAVQANYEEAQTARLVLDYDTKGFDPGNIHPLLNPASMEARLTLLAALSEYAAKLAEVSGEPKTHESPPSAAALGDSLRSLSSPRGLQGRFPGSKLDLNIAATAIDALGHWLIENKRRQELPKITGRMQPAIQIVCDLLAEDMGQPPDAQGKNGRGLRDLLWLEYTRAMNDQQLLIQERPMSAGEKAVEIRKLPEMVRRRKQADRLLEQTKVAILKIAEAHAQIAGAGRAKETLQLKIMDLASEAQRIKDDYDSLSKR